MKSTIVLSLFVQLLVLVFFTGAACKAQYYYKDYIVTRQTREQWRLYKDTKVSATRLSSFESDGKPSEGFLGEQEISADGTLFTTHTKTSGTPESWLFATYTPDGRPLKITDTSDTYMSESEYQFDPAERLLGITNTSTETDNHVKEVEQHLWQYDAQGRPSSMFKIKDGHDTTFVRFVLDEKGNIGEEHASRHGVDFPVIYYYYDDQHQLTDIVKYNQRAGRLLPDYVFEYENNRLSSMLVVQEGSNYQKWYYVYDEKGLKAKDFCYNKQKELIGQITYEYTFR